MPMSSTNACQPEQLRVARMSAANAHLPFHAGWLAWRSLHRRPHACTSDTALVAARDELRSWKASVTEECAALHEPSCLFHSQPSLVNMAAHRVPGVLLINVSVGGFGAGGAVSTNQNPPLKVVTPN